MANPEHVELVRRGPRAIALWRLKHSFERLNLTFADLQGLDLNGFQLLNANLRGANLSRANLSRTDFSEANLTGADLSDADLMCACFVRANLNKANLTNANINHANFSRADLTDADLSGAVVKNSRFKGTKGLNLADTQGNDSVVDHDIEELHEQHQPAQLSRGHIVSLWSLGIFLILLGFCVVVAVIDVLTGGKNVVWEVAFWTIGPCAFTILMAGLWIGSVMTGTDKGYPKWLSICFVGFPFIGNIAYLVRRIVYHLGESDISSQSSIDSGIGEFFKELLFSSYLEFILPLPLLGFLIVTLLPDRNRRDSEYE